LRGSHPPAGLYVHVPFCRHRCHFCAFLITTHLDFLERWERAVVREIQSRAGEFRMPFDTAYFGGGTPSLASPAAIGRILAAARGALDLAEDAEVTLEANPDDLSLSDLVAMRRAGVNRLSLGIQSLDDEDLRFLTRTHTAGQGMAAFRAARTAGFANVTVDLLYGLPGRSLERWRDVLGRTLDLGPDHVSAYQLTFEPGTPFKRRRDKGEIVALTEEGERERFLLTREWLIGAGYRQYEVSSFALEPRFESRHNRKYWEGAPYLGVGPAAHGFSPPERWWNVAATRTWVKAVEEGRSPEAGRESLGSDELRLERVALGLRTAKGARLEDVGGDAETAALLGRIIEEGLAEEDGERLRLTPAGLAVADGIAAELAARRGDGFLAGNPRRPTGC